MIQILRCVTYYIALSLLLSGCITIKSVKDISCYLNDTIYQSDLHLAPTYHTTIGYGDTICNNDRYLEEIMQLDGEIKYLRTILNKQHNIRAYYAYDGDRNLRCCFFEYISYNGYGASIGREYDLNSQGNIINEVNNEEGYSICYKQAIYIGNRYSKWKAHKEFSGRILERGTWQGRKIWGYHYINRKRQSKRLIIDGRSGKILKKYNVFVTY